MPTISHPLLCGNYPLEDMRSREVVLQNMIDNHLGETETSESLLNSPGTVHRRKRKQVSLPEELGDQDGCSKEMENNEEPVNKTARKINHNASERDRRKRINSLYSSLRSLLPPAYQEKKLSIPATVSRVLKYIPELLKEMESLSKKKDCLTKLISEQENSATANKRRKITSTQISSSSSTLMVSVSQVNNGGELMIQMTGMNFSSGLYSKILSKLEQDGLILLNSSCFESSQGRVFYNLHLEVHGAQVMDLERLKRELVSLQESQEESLLSNFKSIGQLANIFYK